MNTFNKYETQGPRDQETTQNPSHQEEQEREYNRPDTKPHPEEKDPRIPSQTPETDNGVPSASAKDHLEDEELMQIEKNQDTHLKGEEEENEEEEEDNEEDDEMDKEETEEEAETEPERNKPTSPGDEFLSPAKPVDTNFEDSAQNRKTDPMSDHETRIPGI